MRRVLVITYYWPPSGGAGVQRWLKFTKYLPLLNWQPVIYTPENPEAPVDDPSLQADILPETEVLKRPIWEPYSVYKRFMGMKPGSRINAGFLSEQEKSHKKEGISVWIRGNFFIPDARKFWIKPSVRYLIKYLHKNPVDAIISTGPPHTMHLIALRLKEKLGVPWMADFRDPWTEIDYYDQLRLTRRADRKHKTLEKHVLHRADRVVVVGRTMSERYNMIAGIQPLVVPNGFDEEDFQKAEKADPLKEFTIIHIGAMNRDRNHAIFWEAVAELLKEEPALTSGFRIRLVGKLDRSVHESIARYALEEQVSVTPYLPHNQIISMLKSASALYLPINNTPNARLIQTGKLFEYLAAGRPILGIGPVDGDAAGIIEECKAGTMIGFDHMEEVKGTLLQWIKLSLDGKLAAETSGTGKFSRRNLTAVLAGELDKLTGAHNRTITKTS